jgi:hypothetical protein
MSNEVKIAMMVSIDRVYRDRLRTMAAEQNLKDPTKVITASGISRDIICEYLDKLEEESHDRNNQKRESD